MSIITVKKNTIPAFLRIAWKKGISLPVIFITWTLVAASQLKTGGRLPDLPQMTVWNYTQPVLQWSELMGKSLILDFWSTNCGACIASFSHLDSLQQQFGDKVQILLVSQESAATIKGFLQKRRKLGIPRVPFIVGDTLLNRLFPQDYNPWIAWIDDNRVVQYITGGGTLSATTLGQFTHHVPLNIEQAIYTTPEAQEQKTMQNDQVNQLFHYFSGIYAYKGGWNPPDRAVDQGKMILTTAPSTITQLLKLAYIPREKRLYFSAAANTVLENIPAPDAVSERLYVYKLVIPQIDSVNARRYFQEDLKRFFRVQASVENRRVKCLALTATGDISLLKTKGGTSIDRLRGQGATSVILTAPRRWQNKDAGLFITRLQYWCDHFLSLPLIDLSGLSGNIDIEMSGEALDNFSLEGLKQELHKHHLDIVETYCNRDVFVIRPAF